MRLFPKRTRAVHSRPMPAFAYIARDSGGRRVKGRAEANSEAALLADLSSRGLAPIRVGPAAAARAGRGVGVRPLSASYRQLSELLR